jgi:hypothetical protein
MYCLIIILNNNPLRLGSRQTLSTVILIWRKKKENYTNAILYVKHLTKYKD